MKWDPFWGDQGNRKCGGLILRDFSKMFGWLFLPRLPVAPPEKIFGPPKGAKGLFSGANCFFVLPWDALAIQIFHHGWF